MRFLVFASSILLSFGVALAAPPETWTGLTEDYPPFNSAKDGEVTGYSTEVVRELFAMQKIPVTIKIGAWNEFFELTKKTPQHFIFTTSRSPEREKMFKWVGPLARDVFYLVAPENSKINPSSDLNELRKYKVSGFEGDHPVQFLEKNGFKVIYIDDDKLRYQKLKKGELDLDILSEISQPAYEKLYDIKFKRIGRMYRQDYYVAFNPTTPDEFINNMNRDLRQFRKTDKFRKIHSKYLPDAVK